MNSSTIKNIQIPQIYWDSGSSTDILKRFSEIFDTFQTNFIFGNNNNEKFFHLVLSNAQKVPISVFYQDSENFKVVVGLLTNHSEGCYDQRDRTEYHCKTHGGMWIVIPDIKFLAQEVFSFKTLTNNPMEFPNTYIKNTVTSENYQIQSTKHIINFNNNVNNFDKDYVDKVIKKSKKKRKHKNNKLDDFNENITCSNIFDNVPEFTYNKQKVSDTVGDYENYNYVDKNCHNNCIENLQNHSTFSHFTQSSADDQHSVSDSIFSNMTDPVSWNEEEKLNVVFNFQKILKSIEPSALLEKYKQPLILKINNLLKNHQEKLNDIAHKITMVKNEKKTILEQQFKNAQLQHKIFLDFLSYVQSKFIHISCLPILNIYNNCEEILTEVNYECKLFQKYSPLYALKEEILVSLESSKVTIISLDACYSAQEFIPYFIHQKDKEHTVVLCEPNAFCASLIAEKCECFGDDNCNKLGYDTEINCVKTDDTKIIFTSTSRLLNYFQKNKFSSLGCSSVVLNCGLRRTKETDFLLACLRNYVIEMEDVKLFILLSLSDNISQFEHFFSSLQPKVLSIPNMVFPVETIWKKVSYSKNFDFMSEIVEIALAIHVNAKIGDVLIFMPSYSDIKKLNNLLQTEFATYKYSDVRFVSIPEELSSEDPLHIFLSDNCDDNNCMIKRTYFLATEWVELLPLRSVNQVIDAGTQKYLQFDSETDSEVLQQSFISQARANLRKYCAGRFKQGTCYRLFSKDDYLNRIPKYEMPEVIGKSPIDITLKMFKYVKNNLQDLDLVQNLPKEQTEKSLQALYDSGIISECGLTSIGKLVIQLPFPLKYSKLIAVGHDRGYAFETIVLVAFFMTKKSVFVCSDDINIQRKVLKAKSKFFTSDSDTFSYLKIYKDWIDHEDKNSFCLENSINFDVMNSIQKTVQGINFVVNRKFKEVVTSEIKLVEIADITALQNILFDSFKDNCCVYDGHSTLGYRNLQSGYRAFPHSFSFLSCERNDLPQFVIFDHLDINFQNYMVNLTAIPKDIIDKAKQNCSFNVQDENLLTGEMKCIVLDNKRTLIKKYVFPKLDDRKLLELENIIRKESKCDNVIIEFSIANGTIKIFVPNDFAIRVKMIATAFLETIAIEYLNMVETLSLALEHFQYKVNLNIALQRGADIVDIDTGINDIEATIVECTSNCSIRITWVRRLCAGNGYISFAANEFQYARRLSGSTIYVKNRKVEVMKGVGSELELHGLPEDTTEKDLRKSINETLKNHFTVQSIHIQNMRLTCGEPFETTEQELKIIKKQIIQTFSMTLDKKSFKVLLPKPDDKDAIMEAYVEINHAHDFEQDLNSLNFKINDTDTDIEDIKYFATVSCYRKIYEHLQESIFLELRHLNESLGNCTALSIQNVDVPNNDYITLKLLANNSSSLFLLKTCIHKFMEGINFSDNDNVNFYKVLNQSSQFWLETLQQKHNVFIVVDEFKMKSLRLYGSVKNCETAIESIKNNILLESEEMSAVIPYTISFPKPVIRKYGVNLENLIKEFQLWYAEINVEEKTINICGENESVKAVTSILTDLLSDFEDCDSNAEFEGQCCICNISFAETDIVDLEYCEHSYCINCLKHFIGQAKFPICCWNENCKHELTKNDIYNILVSDEREKNRLLKISLNNFISKNADKYVYCPTPDCLMFFDKKLHPKFCKLCRNNICVECNSIFHEGFTCDIFKQLNEGTLSYKDWLEANGANKMPCSKCPKSKKFLDYFTKPFKAIFNK